MYINSNVITSLSKNLKLYKVFKRHVHIWVFTGSELNQTGSNNDVQKSLLISYIRSLGGVVSLSHAVGGRPLFFFPLTFPVSCDDRSLTF